MSGVITAMEVVFSSDVGREFSVNLVDRRVVAAEKAIHRDNSYGCGGLDFYEWLHDRLNNEASGAEEYNPAQDYDTGDIVWQNGQYFKSEADNNGNEPISLDDWQLVTKFTDAALEDFWINYVRPWLANGIISKMLFTATYAVGKSGVIEWMDERTGSRAASRTAIHSLKEELLLTVRDFYREMIEEACRLNDEGVVDFSDAGLPLSYKHVSDRISRSRIGFRY